MRGVSKAEGVIEQMTSAITTEDWSLQHCHDYLVELEMVTSGALMALRLRSDGRNLRPWPWQLERVQRPAVLRPARGPERI